MIKKLTVILIIAALAGCSSSDGSDQNKTAETPAGKARAFLITGTYAVTAIQETKGGFELDPEGESDYFISVTREDENNSFYELYLDEGVFSTSDSVPVEPGNEVALVLGGDDTGMLHAYFTFSGDGKTITGTIVEDSYMEGVIYKRPLEAVKISDSPTSLDDMYAEGDESENHEFFLYFGTLDIAVEDGELEMARDALEYGIHPDDELYDYSLLVKAIKTDLPEMVHLLLEYGADPNRELDYIVPLEYAAGLGNLEIVKKLVTSGADLEGFQNREQGNTYPDEGPVFDYLSQLTAASTETFTPPYLASFDILTFKSGYTFEGEILLTFEKEGQDFQYFYEPMIDEVYMDFELFNDSGIINETLVGKDLFIRSYMDARIDARGESVSRQIPVEISLYEPNRFIAGGDDTGGAWKGAALIQKYILDASDFGRQKLLELIELPLRVNRNGGTTEYDSLESISENFDRIFTAKVRKAVFQQNIGALFSNYMGIMFGDGEVWIGYFDEGYKVFTLNL